MLAIVIVVIALAYFLTKGQEPETDIGLIQSQKIVKNFVAYQQQDGTMPIGETKIGQDKRRQIGKKPTSYYHVVDIKTKEGTKSFIIGVDTKTGDITLREPRIGGVTRISEEMKDIIPEKRVLTGEEEIE